MAEKELQEKVLTYRLLEARLDGLIRQRDLILNKAAEIQATLTTIEEVGKKPDEILVPIGAEAYAHAKIIDENRMLVEIGAGIVLEKTPEEAKQILNKRGTELTNVASDLQKEIMKISQLMQSLAPEIQKLADESKAG